MKKHSPAAIAKLVSLLDSKDELVCFSAAREILDRNLGKPTMPEGEGSRSIVIKWMGDGPARYGDSIDAPKDITPKDGWNETMAKAIGRMAHAPADDEEDEDLAQTEMEN